jgi:hypothetical protein
MRQLKILLLAALLLVFVAGVGTGAWIGTLAAATKGPPSVDRRVRDFQRFLDLSPTQVRQLREILHDFDRNCRKVMEPTAEQFQARLALQAESRGRIRGILSETQLLEYDRRVGSR